MYIPNNYNTFNIGEYGNPFRYQLYLLLFIHVFNNPNKIIVGNNNILWVDLRYDIYSIKYLYGNSYELYYVLLCECNKSHFGCFITINNKLYIFHWKK
jgi:hypothetical protein